MKEIEPHTSNNRNLIASSLLEIAFEGNPKGYRTPEIEKRPREKTACSTPQAHFHFNKICFGFMVAPATYQRCRDAIRDKWIPVTTAWRVFRLQMEERPPIWRVAANILNKQSRQPTRSGAPTWGLGELLTTPHRKK